MPANLTWSFDEIACSGCNELVDVSLRGDLRQKESVKTPVVVEVEPVQKFDSVKSSRPRLPSRGRRNIVSFSEVENENRMPDSEKDGLFIVERIDGVNMETHDFLVKWKGYAKLTWEPEQTLVEADAEDLILEFKRRWNKRYPGNRFLDT
eukprot:Blabericola_migrator_1__9267@NODE_4987_length_913_cov_3_275414_g3138_i0_p1_GENE_NODE_4987_length_913_cov_3_275414_g3138_i0NODE_4987_length_913_cov_3_275414_g3138_i0_p1_ORF_typecomplete_len150_score19_98Chromo/PF00385_24/1_4e07_NODE_4987_length_913_cov_3_275414_g3138_i070519